MMHSKHLILHDEVGWGRNPSALHAQNRLLLRYSFKNKTKLWYILSQISCYPRGAIILRTKAICSKRMRNVFWSCEDEFRKNVLKTLSLRFPFHSLKISPGTKYVYDLQYRLFLPRKETLTLPRCQRASRFSRDFICLFFFLSSSVFISTTISHWRGFNGFDRRTVLFLYI